MRFRISGFYYLWFTFFGGVFGKDVLRILGGISSEIKDYPYQVSLRSRSRHTCGGSIIDESHILTAAHCIYPSFRPPYANIAVYSGTNWSSGIRGNRHRVEDIKVHPEYQGESTNYHHDIAVIKLKEKMVFSDTQDKIKLPSRDAAYGEQAVTSGWGLMEYPSDRTPEILQSAKMTVIPGKSCRRYFGYNQNVLNDKDQLCALQKQGVGVCSGDSGGPLVVGDEIVGITSWVIPCGQGYPDVYTNVYAYKEWIEGILLN